MSSDIHRFDAAAGGYSFDPVRLLQKRPPTEHVDPVAAQTPFAHERAHWFQFCGSTIGSAVLTLFRAEDVALLLSQRAISCPRTLLVSRDGSCRTGSRYSRIQLSW